MLDLSRAPACLISDITLHAWTRTPLRSQCCNSAKFPFMSRLENIVALHGRQGPHPSDRTEHRAGEAAPSVTTRDAPAVELPVLRLIHINESAVSRHYRNIGEAEACILPACRASLLDFFIQSEPQSRHGFFGRVGQCIFLRVFALRSPNCFFDEQTCKAMTASLDEIC